MTTGRQPTRLLRLLNYLGILNVVGILCIVLSEHSPPTTPSFPLQHVPSYQSVDVEHKKNRSTNRHKGINETILLLERAGVGVDVDYPRLPPWWWIEDRFEFGNDIAQASLRFDCFWIDGVGFPIVGRNNKNRIDG